MRSARPAAFVVLVSVLTAGCTDTTDSRPRPDAAAASPLVTASQAAMRTVSNAGLTVEVPGDCRISEERATDCAGLRRIKLSRVGPLDDLIRPGIHAGRDGWVGLRVVGASYVYAVGESRTALRDLLSSTQPQS